MKIYLQILFAFLLNFAISQANMSVSTPYGQLLNIKTEKVNGTEYIRASDAAKVIFSKPQKERSSDIYFNKAGSINFLKGSFFFAITYEYSSVVGQMTLPAVAPRASLLVPQESFMTTLANLGIFYIDIDAGIYYVKSHSLINSQKLQSITTLEKLLNAGNSKFEQSLLEETFSSTLKAIGSLPNPVKQNVASTQNKKTETLKIDFESGLPILLETKPNKSSKRMDKQEPNSQIPFNSDQRYTLPSDLKRSELE